MPGDYLFPKRRFKAGEPLDKAEINDALQTSAERLNGHLGPHNIRAPLSTDVVADAGTFFNTVVAFSAVDPLLLSTVGSAAGQSPQPSAQGVFELEQETGWVPVTGGDEDMIVEMSTGSSALSITAQAAHCVGGGEDGVRARYTVQVPLFESPDLAFGRKKNPKELSIGIYLQKLTADEVNVQFRDMLIADLRNFASKADQSAEVARLIAAGAQSAAVSVGTDAEKVQDSGWNSVGYAVRADGRTLTFTKLDYGPVSGDFTLGFTWNTATRSGSANRVMAEARAGSASSSSSEAFSDLPSATDAAGVPRSTTPEVVVYYPAQIQYALRVDGVVITETITGRFDNEQAPFSPARIVNPREGVSPADVSGPMVGRFQERPDAVNIPMFCVRLTASVDVEPGDHVVELVVRRVPTGRRRSFTPPPPEVGDPSSTTTYLPAENRVFVYSRQLAVTDVPIEPVGSAVFGTPAVVRSFEDEEVVSATSLLTRKLQPVADATNDVKSFQVARGAINGDHLEGFSSVIAAGSAVQDTAFFTSNAYRYEYPAGTSSSPAIAFGSQRFFHPVPASWRQLATADVSVDASPPVECVLTVEGNVFIEVLRHNTKNQDQMHLGAACFLVAVRAVSNGAWYAWRPSLAWANSNNYFAHQRTKAVKALYPASGSTPTNKVGLNYLSRYGPNSGTSGSTGDSVVAGDEPGDFVDVPVTAYVDFSGVVAGTVTRALIVSFDQVAIFGAAAWMGRSLSTTEVRVRHSMVNAVVMKS